MFHVHEKRAPETYFQITMRKWKQFLLCQVMYDF